MTVPGPPAASGDEEPLTGGNMTSGVVRVGDTVRRAAGPWTPAVHALLAHLRAAGFDGAPEPLGLDSRGREVLRYVPGTVASGDGFQLLQPEAQLRRAARLIREFHDAAASFVPPAGASWQVLIPPDRAEIIAHHDLAPWNLVMGPQQWAFIDWDTAAPGSRLWDLAWAVLGFVPLSANPALQAPDAESRLRVFTDAYGLDDSGDRQQLVALLGPRARAMHAFLAGQAQRGTQPWLRLWREGHGEAWRSDAAYAEAGASRWHRALTR